MSMPSQPVTTLLLSIEEELSSIRQFMLTANQYATAFPANTAFFMPQSIQQWLNYQMSVLIAQEVALLFGRTPPPNGS